MSKVVRVSPDVMKRLQEIKRAHGLKNMSDAVGYALEVLNPPGTLKEANVGK